MHQHRIAGRVSIGVVDLLEMVDVEHEQGEAGVLALATGQLFGQGSHEGAAVEQVGQGVGCRQVAQFFLQGAAPKDFVFQLVTLGDEVGILSEQAQAIAAEQDFRPEQYAGNEYGQEDEADGVGRRIGCCAGQVGGLQHQVDADEDRATCSRCRLRAAAAA